MSEDISEDAVEKSGEDAAENSGKRNPWLRGLFMLLMMVAVHVCGTVLFVVTIIQFAMMLISDEPNPRLVSFGRSLGGYLQQSANFLTYATEQMPFPFDDWPSGD